jgi:hypothetical protein
VSVVGFGVAFHAKEQRPTTTIALSQVVQSASREWSPGSVVPSRERSSGVEGHYPPPPCAVSVPSAYSVGEVDAGHFTCG